MAGTDNTVTLVGNLTRDPELRFTSTGKAVANAGMAITPRRLVDGQWVDGDPNFFDLTVWDAQAENFAESCVKGTRVIVMGRLRYRSWDDDQGNKRSKVEVVVDHVGPSLQWATAEVTRTAKGSGSSNSHDDGAGYVPDEKPF